MCVWQKIFHVIIEGQWHFHNVERKKCMWSTYIIFSLSFRPAVSCPSSYPFPTSKTISAVNTSYCRRSSTMPSSAGPHVKSRCPQYPGSNIKRLSVPDDKVDWTQKWPEYEPVSYTAPSVLNNPAWADPDIGWATNGTLNAYQVHSGSAMWVMLSDLWSIIDFFLHLFCSSFSPKFNTVDGGVDRTSFEGSYKVENGKPL